MFTRCFIKVATAIAVLVALPAQSQSPSATLSGVDWNALADEMKPTVVKLLVSSSIGLANDFPGRASGTGFIADKERGLIVTNRHVTGIGPMSQLKVSFYNNRAVNGSVLYVDPWVDFAIVKFDPDDPKINFDLQQVTFGAHKDLSPQEQLMLIGHSSGGDYSVKYGAVNKRFVLQKTFRHHHGVHLSLARAGGASGSPLWNAKGEVVALHNEGSANESYEVRIDYIKDALNRIQKGAMPMRGDIFVELKAIKAFEAIDAFGYPHEHIEDGIQENENFHYVLQVEKLIQGTQAHKLLSVGDLIVGMKGVRDPAYTKIGYSVYEFDRIVNQNVGDSVIVKVYRRQGNSSKELEVTLPVADASKSLPRKYLRFAGGIFHDIVPDLSFMYNIPLAGVYLNVADEGSTFARLGGGLNHSGEKTNERAVFIYQINGMDVHNIEDFYREISKLEQDSDFTVTACNNQSFYTGEQCQVLSLTSTTDVKQLYRWNQASLNWEGQGN